MEDPQKELEQCQKEIEAAIEMRRQNLERLCQGKKVDFNASELDDLDALCIAISLIRREDTLESLYLGSNSIKDEGLEALSSALFKHIEIKELYLGSNNFQEPGLQAFINTITELINLKVLSLGLSHINDTICTSLSGALISMNQCSLQSLYLNGNEIGDEGLLSLIVAMNSDKVHINTLHLGDNEFTTVGVKLIADFLETDKDLCRLYLNDNQIDLEGCSDISDGLCMNNTLKFLCLGNCGLNDESFKHILSSLSVNRGLETLHVWNNSISDLTAEMLLEVVEKYNPTLKEMLIFGNQIDNFDRFSTFLNSLLKSSRESTSISED
ncbi:hypothetical protein SteCoe_28603 [Stentor coeruleus]|uniref:Uncharacterized protein n=1 Tax=Stentor coeruleus TaxID=5963 RepID=A0A1R2B7T8_9CILI|nr:hypothetical protein SteCoe_28603 [Stentor coeruleus]